MGAVDNMKGGKTVKSFKEIGDIVLEDVKNYNEWLLSRPKLHACSLCGEKIEYQMEGNQRNNKLGLYFCEGCCEKKPIVVTEMLRARIEELNDE